MSKEVCQATNRRNAVARLRMARSTGNYVLWVEGPDDCVVLERFAAPCCRVYELSGKSYVLRAVREALVARPPLDGFVGLVDRDFDDLHNDPLPARLAIVSSTYADLEASMLSSGAGALLTDLVRREHRESIPWLNAAAGAGPLDSLAATIVAPVGALRSVWNGRHGKIEEPRHPVDDLLDLLQPGQSPTQETLVMALKLRVNPDEAVRIAAAAIKVYTGANPWHLVRGKDMVRAIATVLSAHPEACYYERDNANRLVQKIQEKVITLFDFEVLKSAGTFQQIAKVLDRVGEPLVRYLSLPQS